MTCARIRSVPFMLLAIDLYNRSCALFESSGQVGDPHANERESDLRLREQVPVGLLHLR